MKSTHASFNDYASNIDLRHSGESLVCGDSSPGVALAFIIRLYKSLSSGVYWGMFTHAEVLLVSYIHALPLELFVFVASFIEEVVAPIPSPTVMVLSGSVAAIQDYTIFGLIVIAIIGAIGKTVGAIIVYFIADKAEDVVIGRFGAYFGVAREDIENLGKKLQGGLRDYTVLTVLRALPIMPSSIVSVGCGVLKIPLRLYIVATFIGTILRDGVYLLVGYLGIDMLTSLVKQSSHIESYVEIAILVIVFLFAGYYILKKRRR
jgi:membrane protein DedA with SNARE-associated domain